MNRRASACLFSLLLILLLAPPVAPAQVPMGNIIGVIRVVRGNFPVERIMVRLELRGATMASTYADDEGRFSFHLLPGNIYHVIVDDERYAPVNITVNVNPDVTGTNIVQVMLTVRSRSGANGAAGTGDYIVGVTDLDRNIPKEALKEYERGVKMESESKIDQAIEHYRKAIKAAPDFAVAHNNLGSIYVSKSQFPDAQKEFEQSIRLAPSDSKPYFNMANIMLLTDKLQDAEHYLQEGFRRQPDSAFGFFVQGSVLERSGNLPDAERALQRALELNPKMPRPHLELVNLYLRQQRSADAIAQLRKFLQAAPKDPLAPKAREVLERLQAGSKQSSRH